MANPSAVIVNTPFPGYAVGTLITDAGTIASILAGPYAGDVVPLSIGGGGGAETLSVGVQQAYTGSPISISGSVTNGAPIALDYSIDGGNTWSPVTSYVLTGANWTGKGPVYSTAQSGSIIVRDHAATSVQSTAANFTVTVQSGGGGSSGGTVALADGSKIDGIGAGLALAAGSPGPLSVQFGTVTGAVADGGALATAQATAASASTNAAAALAAASTAGTQAATALAASSSAGSLIAAAQATAASAATAAASAQTLATGALPSSGGTMTGPLTLSSAGPTASAITATGALALSTGTTLTISAPTLYLPSIAAASPGGSGFVWNQAGFLVCTGGGSANMLNTSFAVDPAGSSGIFSRGAVPVPAFPRSGMTHGDRAKISTWYNFGEVFSTATNYDAWSALQNFLLYCQLMALSIKDTGYDNNCYRMHVTCYLPRGQYLISQPLVIPEFVKIDGPGLLIRTPYVGAQTGGSLTTGAFYGTSVTGSQIFLPNVIIVPRAHAGTLNVYTGASNNAYRGSGVAVGICWAAQLGVACTIGSAGSGYHVGDLVTAPIVSIAPYAPCVMQVTAVNGSGGVTAGIIQNSFGAQGAYGLPPSLQTQQWTTANGFPNVFDPAHTGYFLQGSTSGTGSGVSFLPPWRGTFQQNQFDYGNAIQADTIIEHINVVGYVPVVYSQTYGYTYGVMVCGLNGVIGEIEVLGGQAGVYFKYANDWRVGKINSVLSSIFLVIYSSGSIEISQLVADTAGAMMQIDESGRIDITANITFMEEGNLGGGATFVNAEGYAIMLGMASSTNYPNHHLNIRCTLVNMGLLSSGAATTYPNLNVAGAMTQAAMMYLGLTVSSMITVNASNWNESGTGASILPLQAFAEIHPGVQDVVLEGIIDRITGPAMIGPNAATTDGPIRVWDSVANGYAIGCGRYELRGFGTPTSGTSGTGAGKAAAGSTYKDFNTALVYRNTGTMASPTWTNP